MREITPYLPGDGTPEHPPTPLVTTYVAATEAKSNEITAIPELIERIDVKGTIVTIDAMGRQKEIARTIIDAKGDYVPAVKDNQPKRHEAIREFFRDERQGDLVTMPHRRHQTTATGARTSGMMYGRRCPMIFR